MKLHILTVILSLSASHLLFAKDKVLELAKQYESKLLSSTNKYSYATNALTIHYKNNPALASDLTVLTIKHDKTNANRYISFFNEKTGRRFNTNLLSPASLKSVNITITSQDAPRPIQLQSYGGVDPSRP